MRSGMTRAEAAAQIRESVARFEAELGDLSDPAWRFRPDPDAWSIAHVAEHVVKANHGIFRLLSGRLLDHPVAGRTPAVTDVEIPFLFYRGDEPPDVAAPAGDWAGPQAARDRLTASAAQVVDWCGQVAVDMRAFALPHPVFGLLDGVQWLLFAAAHIERHRAQIIGLKRLMGDVQP